MDCSQSLNGVTEFGGKKFTFARPPVTASSCAAKRRSMSFHGVPSGEANCILSSSSAAAAAGVVSCAPASVRRDKAPKVRRLIDRADEGLFANVPDSIFSSAPIQGSSEDVCLLRPSRPRSARSRPAGGLPGDGTGDRCGEGSVRTRSRGFISPKAMHNRCLRPSRRSVATRPQCAAAPGGSIRRAAARVAIAGAVSRRSARRRPGASNRRSD